MVAMAMPGAERVPAMGSGGDGDHHDVNGLKVNNTTAELKLSPSHCNVVLALRVFVRGLYHAIS
jgi:hypothetical protein